MRFPALIGKTQNLIDGGYKTDFVIDEQHAEVAQLLLRKRGQLLMVEITAPEETPA